MSQEVVQCFNRLNQNGSQIPLGKKIYPHALRLQTTYSLPGFVPAESASLWGNFFMPKRFTDSEKWNDPWFYKLPVELKIFWIYLVDNCDHAGIWKMNMDLAEFQTGVKIQWGQNESKIPEKFAGRVEEKNGYWFIPKFIVYQYGDNLNKGDAVSGALKKIENKGFLESLKSLTRVCIDSPRRVKAKAKAKAIANAFIDNTLKPKEAPLPETRPLTDVQKVIKGWKILTNIPTEGPESKSWDQVHFARNAKSAKLLIDLFGYDAAVRCMEYIFYWMQERKLDCTLETVVKRSDIFREVLSKEGK